MLGRGNLPLRPLIEADRDRGLADADVLGDPTRALAGRPSAMPFQLVQFPDGRLALVGRRE